MQGHSRQNIYVITGKVKGGKTTFTADLVERLRRENLKITGFLSLGKFRDGQRSEFTLINLDNGNQVPLATVEKRSDWLKFRRFYFNPLALEQGNQWIRRGVETGPDLVVIDEVGPLELQGEGWYTSLKLLSKKNQIPQIWIVREQILNEVSEQWHIPEDNIIRIDAQDQDQLKNEFTGKLKENNL